MIGKFCISVGKQSPKQIVFYKFWFLGGVVVQCKIKISIYITFSEFILINKNINDFKHKLFLSVLFLFKFLVVEWNKKYQIPICTLQLKKYV